ncbi:MAG: hypothetical protein ACP5IZ_03440 [Thermoprotei archaeon]
MLTTKFVITVTSIYVVSMILIIIFVDYHLIKYLIALISILYLFSIGLKIFNMQNNKNQENILVKESKSRIEYLQSLIDHLIKNKDKQATLIILTEEIRDIGSKILAAYFKINVFEVRSLSLESISNVVDKTTARIIKGEDQLHNEQELSSVIDDLKRLLQNF